MFDTNMKTTKSHSILYQFQTFTSIKNKIDLEGKKPMNQKKKKSRNDHVSLDIIWMSSFLDTSLTSYPPSCTLNELGSNDMLQTIC